MGLFKLLLLPFLLIVSLIGVDGTPRHVETSKVQPLQVQR